MNPHQLKEIKKLGILLPEIDNIDASKIKGLSVINHEITNGQILKYDESEGNLPFTEQAAGGSLFVDRGDVANNDWNKNNLPVVDAWTVLDCSSIVPAGATWILFAFESLTEGGYRHFKLRKNGFANKFNTVMITTVNAFYVVNYAFMVQCDPDRKLQYFRANGSFDDFHLTVRGWVIN